MAPRHCDPGHRDPSRRAFLARIGLLGAAVGAGGLLPRSALAEGAFADPLDRLADRLSPLLDELGRDTWNGFCAFVMPGPDPYSAAQGTPREEAGAMEARVPDLVIDSLNNFVLFPRKPARPIATAVATGISDAGIDLPSGADELLPSEIVTLDRALQRLISSDATIPLSVSVALLLNLVATRVNPAAVQGPFLSPFARLTFAEKARAMSLAADADSDLVHPLDTNFPDPLKDPVSGLLKFVGGALLEFAASGDHSEQAVFDRDGEEDLSEVFRRQPVGGLAGTGRPDRAADQRPSRGTRIVTETTSR
ncbi:hypothetical protein DFQ14_106143 [Halopolyspora algeriensis]|uniref:Uncharacterized protein n=1 Tax=Halopolyspora algeriensis TaxID=1500506 RepID=A0A368VRN2_9ACTN|nr:hypothetical protein [Halopolyspora algeriensis]RCW43665.1 hypothetical protein DFQ14_106143 [Halopolyspora algeriensis]TQM47552.1 hypothetical protein FHU43_3546 [Halopolyspora algeriensis]